MPKTSLKKHKLTHQLPETLCHFSYLFYTTQPKGCNDDNVRIHISFYQRFMWQLGLGESRKNRCNSKLFCRINVREEKQDEILKNSTFSQKEV